MTFDEVTDAVKAKLTEHAPILRVKGKKPYSPSANGSLCVRHDCYLSQVTKEEVEALAEKVLSGLANLTDGFVMSGPRDNMPINGCNAANVTEGNLSLSVVHGYDAATDKGTLRINCWYYPVD